MASIIRRLVKRTEAQMCTEAADAGRFTSKLWHDKDYPRIQLLTVEGLLNGNERIDAPPQINPFVMAGAGINRAQANGDAITLKG
jgi:hypothetical protein